MAGESIQSSMAMDGESQQLIEGVGNEVLMSFVVLLVTSLAIWLILRGTYMNQPRGIHPDHEELVREAREHLYHQEVRNAAAQVGAVDRDEACPICINDIQFAVTTNCGHSFCAACLLEFYVRHRNHPAAVDCPVCRQRVTLLLPEFTDDEVQDATVSVIDQRINQYNRRHSGAPRTLWEYINDVPAMLNFLARNIFAGHGVLVAFRLHFIFLCVLCVLYLLSPLDIIPEAVFGFVGFLDDIAVFIIAVLYLSLVVRRMVQERAEGAHEHPH